MESLRTKVEEHLSCAICLEHFTDPRVLPCLHSYCHDCIVKLDKTGNKITCPECRATVEVGDPPDISFLPSNFFIKNLLATLSLSSETGNLVCENCDSDDLASTRCQKCTRYLCEFCTDAHKRFRDTKDHILHSINELKESVPSMMAETLQCKKHKDEIVKLYCTTCQITICRDCAIVDHRQHNFSFVQDVASEKKDELLKLLEEVKKRKTQVFVGLANVSEREKCLAECTDSTVAEITKYFENLAKLLDAKKNELIKKAVTIKNSKQKMLQVQREELEVRLASYESNIEFTEQAFKNGNDVQLLNLKSYISQSLNTLKNASEIETGNEIQPCVGDHVGFVSHSSGNEIVEKLVDAATVTSIKTNPESFKAICEAGILEGSCRYVKLGKKCSFTIGPANSSVGAEHQVDDVQPKFTGAAVKDISISDSHGRRKLVSFVPLEVGMLKFEARVNGVDAPLCTWNKFVKWEFSEKCGDGRYIGNCVLESGVHSWKINVNHEKCGLDDRADFKVGVIEYESSGSDHTTFGLSGYTKNQSHISLKLDMSTGNLQVTPSWGGRLKSKYAVDCPRVSPFIEIDCDKCDVRILELDEFIF